MALIATSSTEEVHLLPNRRDLTELLQCQPKAAHVHFRVSTRAGAKGKVTEAQPPHYRVQGPGPDGCAFSLSTSQHAADFYQSFTSQHAAQEHASGLTAFSLPVLSVLTCDLALGWGVVGSCG